jgi:hypothetical protein
MKLQDIIQLADPELAEALEDHIGDRLYEFEALARSHPLNPPRPGCVSLAEAFWLWSMARDMQPELIVESGTLDGYSLWWLAQGAPKAKLRSFDPDHTAGPKFPFLDRDHQHHQCEWIMANWPVVTANPEKALLFFDDHQDHGRRLHQAENHGFRHLLFHDCYPSPNASHTSLRFCAISGADFCYQFDRIRSHPVFRETTINPQKYRWLTYVRLKG